MKILHLLLILLLVACTGPAVAPTPDTVGAAVSTADPTPNPSPHSRKGADATRTPPAQVQVPSPSPELLPGETATSTPLPTVEGGTEQSSGEERAACLAVPGQVLSYTLETGLARYPLELSIYLPLCYAEQPERAYPVLYLIHGQSFSDDQWLRLGLPETADRLIAAGEAPPFIAVLPRDREWTQSDQDPFGGMVMEFLLPWVDANFRTLPERRYRAVGGLSRGGGWALHFGLKYADRFGAFGAHSLATFWSDTPQINAWLDAIPTDEMPRIYLDLADRDRQEIAEAVYWFEALLTGRNIPHEWYLFKGQHNEEYWSRNLERYLRWYTAEW